MVLQRLEGLSDREAVERFTFDTRWRYATGVGGYDGDGWDRFAHTVLDSTPLYDAAATMDTVTLIRPAVRGLFRVIGDDLVVGLRVVLTSGDDYASAAKPQIDWDDPVARDGLIDSRARDAFACLAVLDGTELNTEVAEAAGLFARVIGQDIEEGGIDQRDGSRRRRESRHTGRSDRGMAGWHLPQRSGDIGGSAGFVGADRLASYALTDSSGEAIPTDHWTPGRARFAHCGFLQESKPPSKMPGSRERRAHTIPVGDPCRSGRRAWP